MKAEQIIDYIVEIVGVNTTNKLVYNDAIQELSKLKDIVAFRDFAKNEIKNPSYTKFSNGYQKLIRIVDKFNESQNKLDNKEIESIIKYCDKLFKKTTEVFDFLFWESQNPNFDIFSDKTTNFIRDSFSDKDLQVLREIGDRKYIMQLCNRNKTILEDNINRIVHNIVISNKTNIQIENKTINKLKEITR